MVQKRIHDYRGPRSSENLNGHLVGVVPPGVYQGFHVAADGSVSPGMLITPERIRIEETEPLSVIQPEADPINPRIDLVVCIHEYQKTVPAPPAVFTTVSGTAAPDPVPPDIPEHAVPLAACRMEAGADEWGEVMQLGYPVRVYNALPEPGHTWKVGIGARGSLLELFDPNTGTVAVFVVAPGTYADGETIILGAPVLEYDADGILQVQSVQANLDQEIADRDAADTALQNTKLDKTGGTVTGDLVLDGKLTLDADDVNDIVFDDWIEFTRWVQPCQGNSGDWENLGFAWKSVEDALGTTLYVPLPGIIGAELVSVEVGLYNVGAVSYNAILGFSTADWTDFLSSSKDFGEVTVGVDGSESVVTSLPLVDPDPPNDPVPFAFHSAHPLWLRIKTGGAGILFTGAKLNYRRKLVVV